MNLSVPLDFSFSLYFITAERIGPIATISAIQIPEIRSKCANPTIAKTIRKREREGPKSAAAIAAGHDDGKTASGRFRFLSRQLQAALHELRERRDQLGEVLAQAAVTSRMAERYRAARQPVP